MPPNKPHHHQPSRLKSLLWFAPALVAVALAAFGTHPLVLIPLLLANSLSMAAVCHAIGFEPEPRFTHTVLRRGVAHMVLFTAYTALVLLLVAWPLVVLTHAATLTAALLLSGALAVSLGVLWRLWPVFGLVFVWDDAFPAQEQGSWIFTALRRSLSFARHLSAEEHFFTHFLPAAFSLLVMAFGGLALTGTYGVLPEEMRTAGLILYGVLVLPLGGLVVANRTLRVMLCERRGARAHDGHDSSAHTEEPEGTPSAAASAQPAATEPDREHPRGPGDAPNLSPPRNVGADTAALLEAARQGDIERALALLEAGADPNAQPDAQARDRRPVTTLAALLPDTRLLRALIAAGADIKRAQGGLTPLLAATRDSYHGRPEAVLMLLANGADPTVTDQDGRTPLHGAALSAEPNVAAVLLDAEAPINALDRHGVSPLGAACRAGNWPLAAFLLEHRAATAPGGGEPALVSAASGPEDDIDGIKLLLKHKAKPDAVDTQGRSALIAAASEGHAAIVRSLIAAGARLDLADHNGNTALMEAARVGADSVVQALLDAKADPHLRDRYGRDALSLACQSSRARLDTVRALIEHGADPHAHSGDDRSPLDHAATTGRWDLVALMDPDSPRPASLDDARDTETDDAPSPDAATRGPRHLADALRQRQWSTAATFREALASWPAHALAAIYLELADASHDQARLWLLRYGLDAEARLACGTRLFDRLLDDFGSHVAALSQLRQAGATSAGAGLIARALRSCQPDDEAAMTLLQNLLEAGADPFGVDEEGASPLHLACRLRAQDLIETLLERGADPNLRDGHGRSALHVALLHGTDAAPAVRVLVHYGADPEAADAQGETALGLAMAMGDSMLQHWLRWSGAWSLPRRRLHAIDLPAAAAAGDAEAVARLLELGFAPDTRDNHGATALLHACGGGHHDCIQALLEAGADTALAAESGVTPLAAAVHGRHADAVTALLERQACAEQALPGGGTTLLLAAALGHPDIVELLLERGAKADACDEQGQNALHVAAQFCFQSRDSLRCRRLLDALLKHEVPVNAITRQGLSPLLTLLGAHMAPGTATSDATHLGALLPVLLDAGADPAHADARGVTALHACALHALLAPARLLMARGADRHAVDSFGRTPAEVAQVVGFADIAVELGGVGAVPSVRQTLRQPAQPAD
ncbi:hypothetical protein HBF24_11805 [Oleiagrimonas sp. C23AA]|nr:ankyrin repeat domain-containing protein [Oleiagrimonas sp. C23AA]NII11358.1 hypothetical protein [Oleiagrimonas sp. C23AA]